MAQLVERALSQVPSGRVTTYGDIARALGDVRAARAVAEVMASARFDRKSLAHRVVMSDGRLGGPAARGLVEKARRLRKEGVEVEAGHVVRWDDLRVRNFGLPNLFGRFAALQDRLAAKVDLAPLREAPAIAIGVDASYLDESAVAVACAFAFDLARGAEVDQATFEFAPPLPYVPGYLAFREMPGIVEAVASLRATSRRRAVVLVDGQGTLHPRGCGIASMVGLELGLPAVGVAKRLLVGQIGDRARQVGAHEWRDVRMAGRTRGLEIRRSRGPRGAFDSLFVSPGTGLSPAQAARLASSLWKEGERTVYPIMAADRASRRARAAMAPPVVGA